MRSVVRRAADVVPGSDRWIRRYLALRAQAAIRQLTDLDSVLAGSGDSAVGDALLTGDGSRTRVV